MTSDASIPNFFRSIVWSLAIAVSLWMLWVSFPDDSPALLLVLVTGGIALGIFRRFSEDKDFITTLFIAGLAARLAFGMFIYVFELGTFFGADSLTYHDYGSVIRDHWLGLVDSSDSFYQWASLTSRPGWGINYLVAAIYLVVGKNFLAAQSFCAVIGAATAPMVFFCAKKIFANNGVARTSALAVAFFPSFIIWSGQLLKDGIIIFLLVTAMTMVLHLQERISYAAIAVLIMSLFGIITLRFYIFYMVAVAVAGSFLVGLSQKSTSILQRAVVLIVLGLGLTYLGVLRNASSEFQRYADLDVLQVSRDDLAKRAESGFNEEADVSTPEGAVSTIPIGLTYLLLAPFPWQMTTLRQAITLPEVLVWWAMIPLVISGTAYAIRHRLRSAFPILFFSLTLTLAYSIFQGNVGTAYRQRTQIQVFLFIFLAVGWELWREKREDRKMERLSKHNRFDNRL